MCVWLYVYVCGALQLSKRTAGGTVVKAYSSHAARLAGRSCSLLVLHLFALLCQYYPLLCCCCSIFLICRNCMSTTSLVKCFCTTSPPKKKTTTKKRVLTVFGEWLVCSQSFVCLPTAALLFSVLSTYVFVCTMDYTANLKHQFHSCITAEKGGCARIAHLSGEVRIMFEEVVDKVFPF